MLRGCTPIEVSVDYKEIQRGLFSCVHGRPIFQHHVITFLPKTLMANPAQQVPIPQDWLIRRICDWIAHANNNARVQEAMQFGGGWEGWLQVELLLALRPQVIAHDGLNAVQREVRRIWPQLRDSRIDFWFSWSGQDPDQIENTGWGLELKCRTNAEDHEASPASVLSPCALRFIDR